MNLTQTEKTAVVLILLALVTGSIILMTRRRPVPMTVNAAQTETYPVTGTNREPKAPDNSGKPAGKYADDQGHYTRLVIHVGGKVKIPGVYYLRPGSRVVDAVTAAGGGTADADLDSLNLAEPLSDGQKVSIPGLGMQDKTVGAETEKGRPVNINTAGESELDGLPGVGPALAGRIVAYRKSKGPFASVKNLEDVPGIGPKMIEKLAGMAVAK